MTSARLRASISSSRSGGAAAELAGDDLLVRREHDVVELDREEQLVGLDEQVLTVDGQADLALEAVEHALDLQHALARDDDAALELRAREREGQLGQAVTVGRDHGAELAVRLEQHAVEVDASSSAAGTATTGGAGPEAPRRPRSSCSCCWSCGSPVDYDRPAIFLIHTASALVRPPP
jgi:dienelactone hydrolase